MISFPKKINFVIAIMGALLIIVIFSFHKTPTLDDKIKKLDFNDHSIYLIQRGTTGKLGNLAKDFNLENKYASHLGIGFVENHQLIIYHVYVDKNKKNHHNLFIENISDFIKPDDLNYLSVWRLKDIDAEKLHGIRESLRKSEEENINFDYVFDKSDKEYYCSEFIVKKLLRNNITIMSEHRKKVTGMARQILQKDTLTYFPVDGFENTHRAEKILEWIK